MDRRQTGRHAMARWGTVGLALVTALEACGGQARHDSKGSAEHTGGVVGTSGTGGFDEAQAGSGGSGRSAAGGTGGAPRAGGSGGAATGGAGMATGGTPDSAAAGAMGAASGGTSSSAAAGASARPATGGTAGEGGAAAAIGGAPAGAGTGGTASSGGRATGGASTATGGSSSGGETAGNAGAAGFDELLGTWEGSGYVGNCINERRFLTFEAPDRVSYADWNDDACSGAALMGSKSGTFAVSDQHTLRITWDFIEDPQDEAKARCEEKYPFAMGVSSNGTPGIVRDLFVQLDDRTWQYRTFNSCYTIDDLVLESTLIALELRFDGPVPLTGSDECQMTVSAAVARQSKTTDDNGLYTADLYILPCVVEPEDGKQHIRYAGFVGAESADEYSIWVDFLDEQGYQQAHPDWVLALLNGLFFPDLTLDPADPSYLCEYSCRPEWLASEGMAAP